MMAELNCMDDKNSETLLEALKEISSHINEFDLLPQQSVPDSARNVIQKIRQVLEKTGVITLKKNDVKVDEDGSKSNGNDDSPPPSLTSFTLKEETTTTMEVDTHPPVVSTEENDEVVNSETTQDDDKIPPPASPKTTTTIVVEQVATTTTKLAVTQKPIGRQRKFLTAETIKSTPTKVFPSSDQVSASKPPTLIKVEVDNKNTVPENDIKVPETNSQENNKISEESKNISDEDKKEETKNISEEVKKKENKDISDEDKKEDDKNISEDNKEIADGDKKVQEVIVKVEAHNNNVAEDMEEDCGEVDYEDVGIDDGAKDDENDDDYVPEVEKADPLKNRLVVNPTQKSGKRKASNSSSNGAKPIVPEKPLGRSRRSMPVVPVSKLIPAKQRSITERKAGQKPPKLVKMEPNEVVKESNEKDAGEDDMVEPNHDDNEDDDPKADQRGPPKKKLAVNPTQKVNEKIPVASSTPTTTMTTRRVGLISKSVSELTQRPPGRTRRFLPTAKVTPAKQIPHSDPPTIAKAAKLPKLTESTPIAVQPPTLMKVDVNNKKNVSEDIEELYDDEEDDYEYDGDDFDDGEDPELEEDGSSENKFEISSPMIFSGRRRSKMGQRHSSNGPKSPYTYFYELCLEEVNKLYPKNQINYPRVYLQCVERWKAMTDREKRSFRALAKRDRDREELRTAEKSTKITKKLDQVADVTNGGDVNSNGDLVVPPMTSTTTTRTRGKSMRGRGAGALRSRRSVSTTSSRSTPVSTPGQLDDPNSSGFGVKQYRLGNFGSRYRSVAYTHEELQSVLDYVCEQKKHLHTGSIRTWEEAKQNGYFVMRTADAIQQQFRKTIFPNLDTYKCTEEDKRLLHEAREAGRLRLNRLPRRDRTVGDVADDDEYAE